MNIQQAMRIIGAVSAVCMWQLTGVNALAQPQVEIEPAPAVQGMDQTIVGTGFEPDTSYRLAILNEAGEEVFADQIMTNTGGNFTFQVTSEPTDPPGEYSLIVTPVGSGEELASTTWMLQVPATPTADVATVTTAEDVEATVTSTEVLETPEEAKPTEEDSPPTAETGGSAVPEADAEDDDDGLFASAWIWVIALLVIALITVLISVIFRGQRARP